MSQIRLNGSPLSNNCRHVPIVTRVRADKTVALAGMTSYEEVLSIWMIFAVELNSSMVDFANILLTAFIKIGF